MISHVAYLIMC